MLVEHMDQKYPINVQYEILLAVSNEISEGFVEWRLQVQGTYCTNWASSYSTRHSERKTGL